MRKTLLIIFILVTKIATSQAQRSIPNPIILVHGWTGSGSTWTDFTNYLQNQANLTIERNSLRYNLNCDNSLYTSNKFNDVCDANYGTIGNKDVYVVDFHNGNQSNQAGIVKQGYALKFAIQKVLNASGATNVVLMGHSMGGLAIREYLQNSSNWQPDGQHHVAKLATIGTPHSGSNSSFVVLTALLGKDESSESVRDLKESYLYSGCTSGGRNIPCPGVYLWGGQETRTWMKTNIFGGSTFYNIDVNCNGSNGDNVTGLNQKSISTNLDFACIIGGPNNTDGIVSTYSQNLKNIYSGLTVETFSYDCNGDVQCHTNEPKRALLEMIRALDEPKTNLSRINFGTSNKGFFTLQANNNIIDTDEYSIFVSQKGLVSFSAVQVAGSNARLNLKRQNGEIIYSELLSSGLPKNVIVEPGNYIVSFSGSSLGSWATYNFSLGICYLPPNLAINTNQNTNFCSGDSILITSTTGYQNYEWNSNGLPIIENRNETYIIAKTSGNFSVRASSCGISFASNTISAIVKDKPKVPTLNLTTYPDSFLISSTSNNSHKWFVNGDQIENLNASTFTPLQLGSYFALVDSLGCSSSSDMLSVSIEKPEVKLDGSTSICNGESITLELPEGFGKYQLVSNKDSVIQSSNKFLISESGNYLAKTIRGGLSSIFSDTIKIEVKPNPEAPIITYENGFLLSSIAMNNQWYLEDKILKDSTNNRLKISGFGDYSVKVELNGCFAESIFYLVTATELRLENIAYKIYPNPNDGRFWLENLGQKNWLTIKVSDMTGKTIYNSDLPKGSKSTFIDLQINTGIYIIQVIDTMGTTTLKLVRQ